MGFVSDKAKDWVFLNSLQPILVAIAMKEPGQWLGGALFRRFKSGCKVLTAPGLLRLIK